MSEDWKKELESMKKETEEKIAKAREEEEKLREKYKGDKEKIIDLINSELVPIVEVFKKEDMAEMDQPKIQRHQLGISLYLPITGEGTHIGLNMSFGFSFTEKGYAVTTRRGIYDHTKDRVFTIEGHIPAPVTTEGVQNAIREFIRDRNFAIKMREERAKHMKREHG